jgi:tetratricopeptide (TPR) repeat protein/predicted Ser/Thr protein kinase
VSSEQSARALREYWDRVEEIFAAAIAAEDSARSAVLDRQCAARADLRADVEVLLAAHARAGDFIAPQTLSATGGSPRADDGRPPGTRVGAFQLCERIARGGMGDVYRAERADGEFTQQVAIKLIAARLHGAGTLRRFRAERQILASLQHSHIVTFVDGGVTSEGQPFIAMEYIDGLPLTEFCRRHAAPLESRLRLFQQVCAAVAFAHRHLVVHRDLKPGNVLVTGDGIVKVLDFGVAKLLEPHEDIAGATGSLIGPMTPNYASPEQIRGLPVTTGCDVYALGVMLYELVAGVRPYETEGRTADEIRAIVVERNPSRPSLARGGRLPYEQRRLQGDLDAIVIKAMAKDPQRRYTSAEELAADLERFLTARPVIAREPSVLYLARTAIVRHRAAFAVAAAAVVLLAGALVAALWQARIAERERAHAEQRFQQVRSLANYVIYDLQDGVSKLSGATQLRRDMVQKSLAYLDLQAAEAGDDRTLLLEIAGAYHRLGDVLGNPVAANLGDSGGALAAYGKSRAIYDSVLARQGTQADVRRALGRLVLTESDYFRILGPKERAGSAAAEALSVWTALHESDPQNEENLRGLAAAELAWYLQTSRPRDDAAVAHINRALAIFGRLYDAKPDDEDRMRNVALCHRYLVTLYLGRKDDNAAFDHARRAAEFDRRRVARDPHNAAAKVDYAVVLSQMGVVRKRQGRREEALGDYLQSLAIRREIWESDRANVNARDHLMYMLTEIANLEVSLERWSDAQAHAQDAIAHAEALRATVSSSLPLETLIQGYSHLGRAARGLKMDPCHWFRKSLALAPATPNAIESFQYRVAVNAAMQSARDGLADCAR